MKKTMIIIGMGPGLGLGMANKFGNEGYTIGMISRNADKLKGYQQLLTDAGIESVFETADVADTEQLLSAIKLIITQLGTLDVLHYNAVDYRVKNILQENITALTNGFKLSVGNVVEAVNYVLPHLKKTKGAVLLTGGGTSNHPNPDYCTISLAKAGIQNLAFQYSIALKEEGIYVGTLNIHGSISETSTTHSPALLAEQFWKLNEERKDVEVIY
jgi:short-subunit dehydrogenase